MTLPRMCGVQVLRGPAWPIAYGAAAGAYKGKVFIVGGGAAGPDIHGFNL